MKERKLCEIVREVSLRQSEEEIEREVGKWTGGEFWDNVGISNSHMCIGGLVVLPVVM